MGCCRGVCCAAFPYSVTPENLISRWKDVQRPLTKSRTRMERDDLYIADMLIPLDFEERVARADKYDLGCALPDDPWHERTDIQMYTCRHWDEGTKRCTSYEDRPMMCKDFPYDGECEHGCGFKPPEDVQQKWKAINLRHAKAKADGS